MLLQLTVSCFSKIQIGFTFWYWLTRVVPGKGPLNGCECVVELMKLQKRSLLCDYSVLAVYKDIVAVCGRLGNHQLTGELEKNDL